MNHFHNAYLKTPIKKLSPNKIINSLIKDIKSFTVYLGYISSKYDQLFKIYLYRMCCSIEPTLSR